MSYAGIVNSIRIDLFICATPTLARGADYKRLFEGLECRAYNASKNRNMGKAKFYQRPEKKSLRRKKKIGVENAYVFIFQLRLSCTLQGNS